MAQKEIHAPDAYSPATTFSSPRRLRKPSPAEIRHFGERAPVLLGMPHPRIKLASLIYDITNSPAFSWRAASALHSFYPPDDGGQLALTPPQKAAISSAAGLMLHAFNGSEDEAFMISRAVGRLSGCRKDHASEFMRALSTAAAESPGFVRMALEGFPERTPDASILRDYVRTFFLLYEMGEERPALAFAELFSHVGRFPESAKAMTESLYFSLENIRIQDVDEFMVSFSRSWMHTLGSEVFRKNPPD